MYLTYTKSDATFKINIENYIFKMITEKALKCPFRKHLYKRNRHSPNLDLCVEQISPLQDRIQPKTQFKIMTQVQLASAAANSHLTVINSQRRGTRRAS